MKLKKLEVNSFAGISPHSPIVLDFSESKFITLSGDMGAGKTSMLNALLVACGQLSKDDKNFVNLESGKIDINFSFVGKDNCNYEVRVTKSSFKLLYDGVAQLEPINKMKELLGVTGTSPMDIKYKPLKEIVKWVSQYSSRSPEELEKQLNKFKNGIKAAMDTRVAANKSAKAIRETLSKDSMYQNWEESEKVYSEGVDIEELSDKMEEARKKSDQVIQWETGLKGLLESKKKLIADIAKKEEELVALNNDYVKLCKRIIDGEKLIDENIGSREEYDSVKTLYDASSKINQDVFLWEQVKVKKSEMDEFEDISQKADAKHKGLLQEVKELQAEILPNIKGMEIVTEDTEEDGVVKKEGLYRDGKNVAQMSESEWIDTVVEIWRKYRVKVVVLDNIGTLGSAAIERLEKLSKDGCHILAAEMDRTSKELMVSYQ